jgi:hypothetical protein
MIRMQLLEYSFALLGALDDIRLSIPYPLPVLQTLDALPLTLDLAIEPVPVCALTIDLLRWRWFPGLETLL